MRYVYVIAALDESILAEDKTIADLEAMQEEATRDADCDVAWGPSTYAMWEMLEALACYAVKRRGEQVAEKIKYTSLRDMSCTTAWLLDYENRR